MGADFPKLEKYRIIKIIGEGGMGYVYLAEHVKIGRKVAIKVLHSDKLRDPLVRERFKREASLLAKLQHPNIVILYDYEEHPEGLYLIMEYIEGISVSEKLQQEGPIPLQQAKKYFIQILDAFTYAHNKGIIHRDIKPSNIMINTEDNIKILDFGIGKLQDESQSQSITSTGVRLGTLMYMAPEQIEKGEVTFQTDIYSLGLTFFQMLTAHYPYPKDQMTDFQLATKIINEPFPPAGHPYTSVPEPLFYALKKALEKDPEQRYQNCEEFKQAVLEAFELIENDSPTISEEDLLLELLSEDNNDEPTNTFQNLLETTIEATPPEKQKKGNILFLSVIASVLIIIIIASIVIIVKINSGQQENTTAVVDTTSTTDSIQPLTIIKPVEIDTFEQEIEETPQINTQKKYFYNRPDEDETQEVNNEETQITEEDPLKKIDRKLEYSNFRKFLSIEASHKKKLLGRYISDITVRNSADVPYENITFKVIYKDKDEAIINQKTYSFLDKVPANGSQKYQIKHKAPTGTSEIQVKIVKAKPVFE